MGGSWFRHANMCWDFKQGTWERPGGDVRVKHILQAGVEWWGRENSGRGEVSAATAVRALMSRALWPHERLLRQKAVRGPGLSYTSANVLASVIKVVYRGEGMEAENMMVAWHKNILNIFFFLY